MIKIENIGKVFNAHSRNRNEVLKDVSFELPEKGFIAIYGKSGSGKTTLLNIIGGLDRQDSGKIYVDGENVAGKVDKIRNAKIGFIFQNYYLERGYTIAEIMRNAMHIAGFKDEEEIKCRTEEVLTLVDMERFRNKQGDALSGGQKQRVAIARALIKGADVILADEPTGNLDAENTMKVMDILKEISKTKLVVVVTHEITLIKKYADSYIKLVDGKLDENTDLGEVFEYDTEHNNIYVDGTPTGEVKEGALDIEFYGGKPEEKDTIQVFNDNGSIYIKAGRNVTVLDDKSEKKIIFRGTERRSEEEQTARSVPDFTKSTAKRNGRLFTAGSIFKLFRSDGTERAYSTANIFKQVFIFVIAAVLCFLSLMAFEAANTRIENKQLDGNSVYVNMNTYTDLRTLDTSLYENIDFFETQYKQGSFSYNEIASLSGITADYAPKAIEEGDTAESVGLTYGEMPQEGEVLISRALAETLKTQFRLSELNTDRAMLLAVFEGEYRVSGITDGGTPAVHLNKVDYVNFLGVYNTVQFSDYNNLFFAPDFAETTYTSEILLSDSSTLGDNEVTVEINRNSLYKMMTDTTQADYLVNVTNSYLAATSGTSTAIQIVGSRPMYVQRFEITRDVMDTDIRIYVNAETLSDIFVALQPDIDALEGTTSSAGVPSQFYFEIKTEGGEQLKSLTSTLSRLGIRSIDINALYARENAEIMSDATNNLSIFFVVLALLLIVWFFIEKSGSIRNSKEYGIYRAVGVNRSNLLFKEMLTALTSNMIGYIVFYLIVFALMCVRYAVMNTAFGLFVGIALGVMAAGGLLMLAISLIPYLFVLWQTPAEILARYDI